MIARQKKVEFGDFQTPPALAVRVCEYLARMGMQPDTIIEPTCGVGAFVRTAIDAFPSARRVMGLDINESYLSELGKELQSHPGKARVHLELADFFSTPWKERIASEPGRLLILGNLPWVTNSTQGSMGGTNLPAKSNFLGHSGFEAISGKANFDISEWMLLDILSWVRGRAADIAMLVKTAVARKVLAHAERQGEPLATASMVRIDALKDFGAAVDACLLVIRLEPERGRTVSYDYTVYDDFGDRKGHRIGHRQNLTVSDLDLFQANEALLGTSPQKWRSGVKHDASAVMEFTRTVDLYQNGLGEDVPLEETYLYPLYKGSDVGSGKPWRQKFTLVTQTKVGQKTDGIALVAPLTWKYLGDHATQLNARGSSIYQNNPPFSIFGVGDYAFRPWKVAICALYKNLRFRLVGPVEGKPVMFDDTVYYVSFETENEARAVHSSLMAPDCQEFLQSLIFWDEKRPIKTATLNVLDWRKAASFPGDQAQPDQLALEL